MDPVKELLDWAQTKGVKLNGITPKRLPGRGVGVIATRSIKPNEIILQVPTPCLRSKDTVPKQITRKLPKDMTVHGLLAADLALDTSDHHTPWNAICPTPKDLITMPLAWPASLQSLLPGGAKTMLTKQQAKFARDWAAVSSAAAAFPHLDELAYRHAWMLVNTRTFYYDPTTRARKPARSEGRMVLQPVADLFNHDAAAAEPGCGVIGAFDTAGFTARADRAYAPGDEVRICYGRHGGDMLAVEYGFVLSDNAWDEVGLDEIVMPRLGAAWRRRLGDVGFLGGYVLDARTVCYRTQVAVRTLCCGVEEWRRFVDGEDDGEATQGRVDGLLVGMLGEYRERISRVLGEVEGVGDGEEDQRGLLAARWRQIDGLVEMTIARLRSGRVS